MHQVDWAQAWQVVFGGLTVVFVIMSMLALSTHYLGKLIQAIERRRARANSEQAEAGK